jgi:hypothetical protein
MGANVTIKTYPLGTEFDKETYSVKDGIVVIPKRTVLCSGTRIAPDA